MRRALVLLVFVLGCKETNHSHLVFAELMRDVGKIIPAFGCRQGLFQPYLATRAYADGPGHMSVVVDFMTLGGQAGCRASELLSWCDTHSCRPMSDYRVCLDVPLGGTSIGAVSQVSGALRGLAGTLITGDAPGEPVVARVVATAETCASIEAVDPAVHTFDSMKLIGCAYSCPVDFSTFDGDVVLDLDAIGEICAPAVTVCAANPISSAAIPLD